MRGRKYAIITTALAVVAGVALQLTSMSPAAAIPPPCEEKEDHDFSLYGPPKWGGDAKSHPLRNDASFPVERTFTIRNATEFTTTYGTEARIGYNGEAGATVKLIALNVSQELEAQLSFQLQEKVTNDTTETLSYTVPARTTVFHKYGSAVQTIKDRHWIRDEYCHEVINYGYLNIGGHWTYISTVDGEFMDIQETRKALGVADRDGNNRLPEIVPPTCSGVAQSSVSNVSASGGIGIACMPANPTFDVYVGRARPAAPTMPAMPTTGDVAGVVSPAQLVAAFRKGSDAGVWGVSQVSAGGGYGPWARLGGLQSASYPVSLVATNGSIVVAVRGSDNKIWGISQLAPGGSYGSWGQIGTGQPTFTGEPAITLSPSGQIVVYARATDGSVWGVSQLAAGGSYGSWARLGTGYLSSSPATVVSPSGLLVVAGRGSDNKIWGTSQLAPGGSYGSWGQIGTGQPTFTGDPSVMLSPSGQIMIFAQGTDGRIWGVNQLAPGGSYGTWIPIGS